MRYLDELHEILGWTLVALAVTGVATERLADWPGVVVVVVAVGLLVGPRRLEAVLEALRASVLDGLSASVGPLDISFDDEQET